MTILIFIWHWNYFPVIFALLFYFAYLLNKADMLVTTLAYVYWVIMQTIPLLLLLIVFWNQGLLVRSIILGLWVISGVTIMLLPERMKIFLSEVMPIEESDGTDRSW